MGFESVSCLHFFLRGNCCERPLLWAGWSCAPGHLCEAVALFHRKAIAFDRPTARALRFLSLRLPSAEGKLRPSGLTPPLFSEQAESSLGLWKNLVRPPR